MEESDQSPPGDFDKKLRNERMSFFRFFSTIFLFILICETCCAYTLLVTGCGRSGTRFLSEFLEESGYSIKHEKPGEEGCVSWPMSVNSYSPWGPESEDTFEHVFHQVRNPLAVITSWLINLDDLSRDEWIFIRQHVPEIDPEDSLIVQCAKYWYYWNLLAEEKAEWRYQIENLEEVLPEFMKRSGLVLNRKILRRVPRNINTWKVIQEQITWNDLKSQIPEDLYINIRNMAYRYGYISNPSVRGTP